MSKAERRKAAKKRKKEASRAAARGEGAGDEESNDQRDNGAKRARLEDTAAAAAAAAAARQQERPRGAVTLRKGVRMIELSEGRGPTVQDRKRVKVSYVGRLGSPSGAIFDQGTISFRLGRGEVIAGWDIGVQGMRVGGERRITVPPAAGYGKQAAGKIPPNSTLCFDVAVVEV